MGSQVYRIFTKNGDAREEVDALVARLDRDADAASGFHKHIFVTRADQTVVFVSGRTAPLAEALRSVPGWAEPEQDG